MNEIRKLLSDVPRYDAGIINDFGGGNTEWWMDYLRAEVGRANEHWQSIVDEALPLLTPEGETRRWKDRAALHASIGLPDGFTFAICKVPHVIIQYIDKLEELLLAEPAPSSEKALSARIEGLKKTYSTLVGGPSEHGWNAAIDAVLSLLASSPAPSVECPNCLGHGYNTDTQGEREKCGWCQGLGRVNQAPAPEAPKGGANESEML